MLDIYIKPIRGILYVKLSGKLDKKNSKKLKQELIILLQNVGIKNIVFNIDNLDYIDNYGKNVLINSFKICKNNNGQSFVCFCKNKTILKQIKKFTNNIVEDERMAVKLVDL